MQNSAHLNIILQIDFADECYAVKQLFKRMSSLKRINPYASRLTMIRTIAA